MCKGNSRADKLRKYYNNPDFKPKSPGFKRIKFYSKAQAIDKLLPYLKMKR